MAAHILATLPGDATVYLPYRMVEYPATYTIQIAVDVVEIIYHTYKLISSMNYDAMALNKVELFFSDHIRIVSWEEMGRPVSDDDQLFDTEALVPEEQQVPWYHLHPDRIHRVFLDGVAIYFYDNEPKVYINFSYHPKEPFEIQYTVILYEQDLERLWEDVQNIKSGEQGLALS